VTTKIAQSCEGPLEVANELALYGMITGDVTVLAGGYLHLNGTCCANLRVEPGATVALDGTVAGNVSNDGGTLHVRGRISGQLLRFRGETTVYPGAVVAGTVH
jgi:cytoskeletal protein CcmA (bactofilin family)